MTSPGTIQREADELEADEPAAEQDICLPARDELVQASEQPASESVWRRLTTGPFMSLCDQALVSGTSFATTVMIGRLCGPAELGVFSLLWGVVLFLRATQNDLVTSPYVIYSQRYDGRRRREYNGSTFVQEVVVTVLSLVVFAAIISASSYGWLPASIEGCTAILLAAPFVLLREYARNVSYASLSLRTVLVIDFFAAVLQLGGIGALIWFNQVNLQAVFCVISASCGVVSIVWLLSGRHPMRLQPGLMFTQWTRNWMFGRWAFASQIAGRATGYLLPWIVTFVHGSSETGMLAAYMTLINLAGTYITGISNYLTPRAAKAYTDGGIGELNQVLKRAILIYGVVLVPFSIAMAFSGSILARWVFGESYDTSSVVLTILALMTLVNSASIVIGNGLWAMEKPEGNFAADVVSMVTSLTILAFLIHPFGILGAAVALLVGSALGTIVRFRVLRQNMHQRVCSPVAL